MSLTICLTHDVDRVYKTYQYLTQDVRKLELRRLRTLVNGESPYWCFDRLRKLEDRHGVRSSFFFLEESIPVQWFSPRSIMLGAGRYSFADRKVATVIRELDADGWDVGLHGSYRSYRSLPLLKREKERLEQVLGREVIGIRQHHLNLDIPETWRLHQEAGLRYDASYGLKRAIGFANGAYQPFVDESSGILVIPLALMECFLFGAAARDVEAAWRLTLKLLDEAEAQNAVFVVLWHQRMFNTEEFPGHATIYERLIVECRQRGARFRTCGEVYEEWRESAITWRALPLQSSAAAAIPVGAAGSPVLPGSHA
jgi:peptidoglycan/xylan/chitin deacetylase (PgdA/CDA1 family)